MIYLLLATWSAIPGIDRVEVDGMEVVPNITLCDPRPLTWRDSSGALVRRQMVVTIYCNSQPFTWATIEPITRILRVDLSNGAGETWVYEWKYCGPKRAGDLDGDGDIDQTDFGLLQRCLSSWETPSADCWEADLNGDASVDQSDVQILLDAMTGDNR